MIITKNSDMAKLYGVSKVVSISDANGDFVGFDALGDALATHGTTANEVDYILMMATLAATGEPIQSMILSESAATALEAALVEMDAEGTAIPFSVEEEDFVSCKVGDSYAYTFTLDGSGISATSGANLFLAKVVKFDNDVTAYKEVLFPLCEGVLSKKDNSDNVEVTVMLPNLTEAAQLYHAINSSLTEMDEEGYDITEFFDGGTCNDDPEGN